MGEHVIKLPDVGEGVAEAELVEWLVDVGANVVEDQPLAAVMTDKATVEIPSPVEGKIIWQGAKLGDVVAVGAPLIRLDVDGAGNIAEGEELGGDACAANSSEVPAVEAATPTSDIAEADHLNGAATDGADAISSKIQSGTASSSTFDEKPMASPAVRRRALDKGVDLRQVCGSGPAGQFSHGDLDAYVNGDAETMVGGPAQSINTHIEEIPVIGLRRKVAEKMATANSRIPHITYVEEIDMTALENLRKQLNGSRAQGRPKVTLLPFLMRAVVCAIADAPQMNARFDDDAGVIRQHGGVHIGVAAQTDNGLVVPVARHVEARDIWSCAEEVARLSEAARGGSLSREELTGSTITITSLGALGGIVTTPVINYPEVAIIGVNKLQVKPVWDGTEFRPRTMMNLSSSFDHRVIDGWDAAVFIQHIKKLLETPAMIFIG